MTIVSKGYEGTIAPNVPWAQMNQAYGHEYVASHYDAGRVSIVPGGTRTVRVNVSPVVNGLQTGIGGHGVFDAVTVAEDITITASLPSTGQVKWYLIVARRTWQTVQATSFVAITGTASEALPARNTTPGTIDDQPLALVQITGGQTVPTAIRDLRPVSRNGVYVVDPAARDLVMSYFNQVGYRLNVDGVEWVRRVSDTGGTLVWSPTSVVTAYSPLVGVGGWAAGTEAPRFRRVGDEIVGSGLVVRTFDTTIGYDGIKVGDLPTGMWPAENTGFVVAGDVPGALLGIEVRTNGVVQARNWTRSNVLMAKDHFLSLAQVRFRAAT